MRLKILKNVVDPVEASFYSLKSDIIFHYDVIFVTVIFTHDMYFLYAIFNSVAERLSRE